MTYKIITDSSSDLCELSLIPFSFVPLKIRTSEKEYTDTTSLNVSEMIDELEKYKGKSGSSCPNSQEWMSAFGDADNIFCVTITKNLSGSYNSALTAASEYTKGNDGKQVHVFDTLTVGPENELIIEKISSLILDGEEFSSIVEKVNEYAKSTSLFFSLESLHNLANNGRANPIVAKMAGALGIRIVGKASDAGTLEVTGKARGEKKALELLKSKMLDAGYAGGSVRIHHCENEAAAKALSDAITTHYPTADVKISKTRGLCSFYAERGGLLIGFEH